MKLSKKEQAVVIGTLCTLLGTEEVEQHIDQEKMKKAIPAFNEIEDNTSPRMRREAFISVLDKTLDDFLRNINVIDVQG
ncbi:hypothetical protein P4U05_16950 [Bacillus paranthracis]|uniref:hypothetical protein n=1 Tax=Bacillus phage phi4B1 TaxID=1643324 RepID=UPI000200F427|nr:hypothetical protein [Bacillus paranthracis]YP_009206307.1 hypothetical protein XO26_0008 [Bacillus phage phi4B1]ADY20359.1 phage protein [Bacillus thuringiensis serovar finitimus YBT-020]MRC72848.1 hypothetical protein [Bacillus thuringiensis]OTX71301.1 hypothetical protein BK722_12875 [Bacillus thuringiensis serovar finitimus]PGZ45701.1 hypothetical protein COE56_25815 [Bacillus anthracis]ALF02589.1 hypothetical protein XO26_0008 [Bacillus phage phi4B1]